MKKLYKEGKECNAEDNQVDLMCKAGWSLEKPEVEDSKPEVDVEAPVKKVAKRKVIKKTTPEE